MNNCMQGATEHRNQDYEVIGQEPLLSSLQHRYALCFDVLYSRSNPDFVNKAKKTILVYCTAALYAFESAETT
jgi:hypothetical protein